MVQQTTFLLACLACLSAPAIAADPIQACYDKARTQPELTHCSGLASQQADKELNAVYQAVLKRHNADRVFSEKFKAAQRAWLKWRDAEMEAIYPDSDQPQRSYGSGFPIAGATRSRRSPGNARNSSGNGRTASKKANCASALSRSGNEHG